jgi:eukaryotic-like serine/threonine-protein kinase
MVGRTISHYRILDRIGGGGMGVVYRATDVRLDRLVAIKILTPDRVTDAEWRRRFVFEAKAASSLNHPHIVTVYDIDSADGVDFIAMEHVAGRTLHDRLGGKGLPVGEALKYLRQLVEALSAAHAAGLVHRDVKPANILVSDSGHLKLADFGLARIGATPASAADETATAPPQLTEPGTMLGTIDYASPEQARGEAVDQRTDVWAFGCVLFETLTGRRPFGRGAPADILARILETEPDWSLLPAATPASIRQLLRLCLRKDPDRRLRRIDPILLDAADELAAGTVPQSRRMLAVWIALGLAAGALAGWVLAKRSNVPAAPAPLVRVTLPIPAVIAAGAFARPVVAVAPDGSAVVFVNQVPGDPPRLFVRRLNGRESVALAGTEGASSPFFSPDGRDVAFFVGLRLRRVSIEQGGAQTICDVSGTPAGGAWTRRGVILFGAMGGGGFGLMSVPASGGKPDLLSQITGGEAQHRWPSVSPDGRVVVFTTTNSTGPGLEEPKIVAQSIDSGRRQTLPVEATYALFAPDGLHLILVRGANMAAVAFDPDQLRTIGSPVPFLEGVMQSSSGAAQVAVSSLSLVYFHGGLETRRLVWVDRTGTVTPVDAPPRLYVHPRLSPDGRRIAVAITEPKNDIWIIDDIARAALTRLTFEGSNAYPIWTPDGKRITYVSSQQGRPPNLFWKAVDAAGAEERLDSTDNVQVSESWHPDGSLLFVELRRSTGWDILTLTRPPAGTPRKADFQATAFLDGTPQISPTGRWLAYISNESSRQEVFVRSFPGPEFKKQVSEGPSSSSQPAWRGDERELFFRSGDGMMAADLTLGPTPRIGKPALLFRGPFANIQGKNYDVTRDGQRFLMVEPIEPVPPRDMTIVLNWMDDLRARIR